MLQISGLNQIILLCGIGGMVLLAGLITLVVILIVRVNKLKREYQYFMKDADGDDISATLRACIGQIDLLTDQTQDQYNKIADIYDRLTECSQKVGMIRFNAFDNVGSNQSFALAMLDEKNNGFVLSGIYARESSTTYMKPIKNGKSKYPLAEEEEKAVLKAMGYFKNHTDREDDNL